MEQRTAGLRAHAKVLALIAPFGKIFADVLSGTMTVQQALDWMQKNWEESYSGLPAA